MRGNLISSIERTIREKADKHYKKGCSELLSLKRKEIGFILGRYYSDQDLASLLHPLAEYQDSFQYFVLQNHFKAKTVEELAEMRGYTVTTFLPAHLQNSI